MSLVLGTRVDATTYAAATQQILGWASASESRYVCVANVHVLMEAHDSPDFRKVLEGADLVTPDGMPLVWMLRLKGHTLPDRVYGPTLMQWVLQRAEAERVPIGLYGSTPEVMNSLCRVLSETMPKLEIVYKCSPPFRAAATAEDQEICDEINVSGARILFVGLGCPKQERWMAEHRGRVRAVTLGVGAAFDFLAGNKPQAPAWMQRLGLEWGFRLWHEPRRLSRRYLINNPRFAALALAEILRKAPSGLQPGGKDG